MVTTRLPAVDYNAEFKDVTVRVGNVDSIGQPSIAAANAVCGVFGPDEDSTRNLMCATPICGRYVGLEKASKRFEVGEMYVNDCGLGQSCL